MDPDGAAEVVDAEKAVGGRRAAGALAEPEGAVAAGKEVAGLVQRVEAEQVAAEKGLEDSDAKGKGKEEVRGGKGGMEGEAEADVRVAATEDRGKEEEMVVLHPDEVRSRGEGSGDRVRKEGRGSVPGRGGVMVVAGFVYGERENGMEGAVEVFVADAGDDGLCFWREEDRKEEEVMEAEALGGEVDT